MAGKTFSEIVSGIATQLGNYFVSFMAGLSLIVFMWGITKYIFKGDSEAERKKGGQLMFWGLIGLFVLFSVWGILEILGATFNIDIALPLFKS